MEEDLARLKALTDAVYPLPANDWAAFAGLWQPFRAGRKEVLTRIGGQEPYLYFVTEGVQRVYYFDDEGREATLVFTYAPSFGGVLDAMMLHQPSRYAYETLTASAFLRASYRDVAQLMQSSLSVANMVRIGLAAALSGLLERLAEVQCYSSADKFRKLLERSPHILQLVPHRYLANYLGIDPSNFSKLLNSIRI
ncbi:Crp/Fnr family transcriptional regulator [Taibaiella koreensis]|uniref:Crp/Fnr family transcriptional regulator n=1 Tax=Taibaiella koreensis TaxID=1268548 RepID=UPI000E59A48E|nr:cyclic nucleotide-binding domain-containing protein [Taibaiella koreensis]